jgi:integrase
MRQGEILGLTWKNIDLATRQLRVEHSVQRVGKDYKLLPPKTEKSRRTVQVTRRVVDALTAHGERQQAAPVVNLAWADLVFRASDGGPLNGSWVHHRFQASAKDAGLPVIRFHDLRHSCVSVLGEEGVDVAVVSKMIGHSTVTLTLNTYRHVFEKTERAAADALEAALG